jgi:hypothetical protein
MSAAVFKTLSVRVATRVLMALLLSAAAQPAAAERSCGWLVQASGDQLNVLYPDKTATYWGAFAPIPDGAHVEISGTFPYARYMALTVYNIPQFLTIDHLHDAQILPDAGNSNPFVAGADRRATDRRYTVRIVNEPVPQGPRPPNTLYNATADGSRSSVALRMTSFMLRIYQGELGTDETGGVPLPDIAVVLASGERLSYPPCPDTRLPDLGIWELLAAAGLGFPLPVPESDLWGDNPPVWDRFVPFGLFDNVDNAYIYTTFTPDHGEVVAFRGRAPTYVPTRNGEQRMGGGTQVRYWSVCTNLRTTQFLDCAADDQIPLDAQGNYTIVVSTAASRPRNATTDCGYAWLPGGPLNQTVLALRHMLPAPDFAEAVQNTSVGVVEPVLGDYYPRGTYYATTLDFEKLGCAAAAAQASRGQSTAGGGALSCDALAILLAALLIAASRSRPSATLEATLPDGRDLTVAGLPIDAVVEVDVRSGGVRSLRAAVIQLDSASGEPQP